MVDLGTMLNLQLMLFLLMIVGIFIRNKGIVTEESRKSLSDLLINIILPCNIIASFNQAMSSEMLIKSAEVLAISFGVQLVSIFFSTILYRSVPHDKQMVLRYGTICSNASFIGLPVINGVYGAEGVLYASIALLPLRIFMWSAGLSLFTKTDRKTMFKTLITHPCIVSVFIGFAIMITGIKLPEFLDKTIVSLSSCNTAVSMLVIGTILAEINVKTVVNKTVLYYAAIRLVFLPLIIFSILRIFHIDSLLTGVVVLMTGMPAGSTTGILAAKYNCDAQFASKCIFISTLLSLITIPILGIIL